MAFIGLLLKIIFGTIGILLLFALVLLFLILFVAFHYRINVEKGTDTWKAEGTVAWLYPFVRGAVSWNDEGFAWKLRVFLFCFSSKATDIKTMKEETIEETETVIHVEPIAHDEVAKPKESATESIATEKMPPPKREEKGKKEKAKQTKPRGSIIASVLEFFGDEENKHALHKLKQELVGLLKKIMPKELVLKGEYGFDDPSITGQITAVVACLLPIYGKNLQVTPNFQEAILEGEMVAVGHLRLILVVKSGIVLLMDRTIREAIVRWF